VQKKYFNANIKNIKNDLKKNINQVKKDFRKL
jgi:hypothetical protein